jgi:hypothetical protein
VVAEALANRLSQWTVRQMKKLSAIDKAYEHEFPASKAQFVQLFLKYSNIIGKEAEADLQGLESGKNDAQSLGSH